jgi:hypothetical protein
MRETGSHLFPGPLSISDLLGLVETLMTPPRSEVELLQASYQLSTDDDGPIVDPLHA